MQPIIGLVDVKYKQYIYAYDHLSLCRPNTNCDQITMQFPTFLCVTRSIIACKQRRTLLRQPFSVVIVFKYSESTDGGCKLLQFGFYCKLCNSMAYCHFMRSVAVSCHSSSTSSCCNVQQTCERKAKNTTANIIIVPTHQETETLRQMHVARLSNTEKVHNSM